jgi:hypothetical protein
MRRVFKSAIELILLACIRLMGLSYFQTSRFDSRSDETKIVGRTPQQVLVQIGPPDFDSINDPAGSGTDEDRVMVYYGPWGDRCRIGFKGGVATRVTHWGK